MNTPSHLTLKQLNLLVRSTIERQLPDEYWVEAELSEIRERGGHCYMDLVEKEEGYNTPVAHASARCWRQTWAMVRPTFEQATGQRLAAGMKVLLKVYAQFHENYGFSWIVTDIDPTYTLGDLARRRKEIIATLTREGVIDLNRSLSLPLFTQHIAVISSSSAAGYGDFCRQLADNDYGFYFSTTLFPATLQGEDVERSIISALDKIAMAGNAFDCVVIIRGGGAVSDMSGFDTLALAEHVANFPLPVITGIGHDRDECVLDMVAHTRVKTPTAAAAFLIARLCETASRVDSALQRITLSLRTRTEREMGRLEKLHTRLTSLFLVVRDRQETRLRMKVDRILTALKLRLQREHHRLDILTQRTEAQDPMLILRRGYSITTVDGKAVKEAGQLREGMQIVTHLAKGTVESTVTKKQEETI